jgi:hypothetical protein
MALEVVPHEYDRTRTKGRKSTDYTARSQAESALAKRYIMVGFALVVEQF